MQWIDSHCHLDASEFDADRAAERLRARALGVHRCVWPCVQAKDFSSIAALARAQGDAYALGIHPLYTPHAHTQDLMLLEKHLQTPDAHRVAVGEIGLDAFVPQLTEPTAWKKQLDFYRAQLQLAQQHGLPVILHVRRSADQLLKGLRDIRVCGGIAHAFNGSLQQAKAFIDLGFKLGFGGAITYERATHLRDLVRALPLESLVLETDAPDMPPHWLYVTAQARANGQPQGRNSPAQLPRIAEQIAQIRDITPTELAVATHANTIAALTRLQWLS